MEKSHTKRWQRIFIFVIALLFIATSASLTIIAVTSNNSTNASNNANSQTGAQNQAAINQAKKINGDTGGSMLQGTEMKDFTPVASVSSLSSTDLVAGNGAAVKPGDTVTVEYTGAVAATGKIFQSSLDSGQPATFPLSQVIKGWTEGIPGMKVGGTRRLLIPANLAYGANPPAGSGIPANADLVFNVTLLSIGQ